MPVAAIAGVASSICFTLRISSGSVSSPSLLPKWPITSHSLGRRLFGQPLGNVDKLRISFCHLGRPSAGRIHPN